MSETHEIKGTCPGALTPMMSGDGIVVRVRPFGGRLARAQADGIATLAAAHGNGLLDLTSRGNLQIRGVTEDSYPALLEGLGAMSLLDPTPEIEARRNILVTPFWLPGDETEVIAAALTEALSSEGAPVLPHKFGFAVDTGPSPVLRGGSADIRLERDAGGGLLLVADGAAAGKPVTTDTIVDEAIKLAEWFLAQRESETRMAAMVQRLGAPPAGHFVPVEAQSYQPAPGPTPIGAMVGLAFGQLRVETLSALAKHGGLRMTPWRMLAVESARMLPDIDGLITDPSSPLLQITACTGSPACPQGHVDTRALAQELVGHAPKDGVLHISGCTKGCAHPKAAPWTVVGTPDGLALVRDGRASDAPQAGGLTLQDIQDTI